jgi:basic amino acid/polyamine antiporter, APA family
VFGDWIFFGLTAATLFVLRRRDGDAPITFKTPLHPVTTLLFIAAAVYVVVGSIWAHPGNAVRGTGLLLLGVPIFFYWRGRATSH